MEITLHYTTAKPPKTTFDKDGLGGVRQITTVSFEVVGLEPRLVTRLACAAVYGHPVTLTLQLPQEAMILDEPVSIRPVDTATGELLDGVEKV